MKYLLPFLLLPLAVACVPKKKYEELLVENERLQALKDECEESLASQEEAFERLEASLDDQLATANELNRRLAEEQAAYAGLEKELEAAEQRYQNALAGSSATKQALLAQQEEVAQLKADLQAQQARMQELEDIIKEKEQAIEAIRQRIRQALLAFDDDELTVEVRDGKVYVSLAENLLFGSGSIAVDPKGKDALQKLAAAVKDEQDLDLIVEGHTDDVPISNTSRYMKDNWDLSVMRATSITRIFIEAGVPPEMITAAGRGEHVPVATNDTAAGRSLNRRTEIILAPNLDELFQLGE